jgi:protein-S-isoprenylcysteine O-methyltransferase Ste14
MNTDNIALASRAIGGLWLLWVISWVLAAHWSARTVKTTRPGERTIEVLLTLTAGYVLMQGGTPQLGARFYSLGMLAAWALTGLVAAGFGLCWWARLHLGQLWSANITLKQGHRIVDTGPYALVRHPIYTGLLLATWATAAVQANLFGATGAVLMTAGCYLKARREEQLLTAELGTSYETYRRHVPMLLPRLSARTGGAPG